MRATWISFLIIHATAGTLQKMNMCVCDSLHYDSMDFTAAAHPPISRVTAYILQLRRRLGQEDGQLDGKKPLGRQYHRGQHPVPSTRALGDRPEIRSWAQISATLVGPTATYIECYLS